MGNIFVSYRREDSQAVTDRIFDHLAHYFPRKSLFKDVDNIPPGVDFRVQIDKAVRDSAVMLAIIGPDWLSVKNAAGQRRLDDPGDFVCMELASALQLRRPVVPVLVDGAHMPAANELPVALKELAYINAVPVRPDPDFAGDFARLRRALEPMVGRWYSGWIRPAVLAAAALGAVVVIAVAWYQVVRPMLVWRVINDGGLIMSPKPDEVLPPQPPKNCVDVPFNDTTKVPPVTTTKRICS